MPRCFQKLRKQPAFSKLPELNKPTSSVACAIFATLSLLGCSSHPLATETGSRGVASEEFVETPSCDSIGWSDVVTPEHQAIINQMMGTREHRVHHALWHAIRGGLDSKNASEVTRAFGTTWKLPHPLCPAPADDSAQRAYNPAGEDFLFMHRQMVRGLQDAFVQMNLPCIRGWASVPSQAEYPIPDRDRADAKSDAAYRQIKIWEGYFMDENWLKSKSLSQVGWALEFSIHNNLHMRYATTRPPKGFQELAEIGGAPLPLNDRFPQNWKYDSPAYNWLQDPYGAAVNPTFWKIHGYVDAMIDRWLLANGYSSISSDCKGDRKCYQWQGRWTGDGVHSHAMMNHDFRLHPWQDASAQAAVSPDERQPAAAAVIDPVTAEFTKQRMARQRVGVILQEDVRTEPKAPPGGVVAAGPPTSPDPYFYVRGLECNQ